MKSYLNLKEEVWDRETCSGCGACVSVCPTENIYFKQQSPVQFDCDECACIIVPTENGESPISAEFCKVTLYDVNCGACYNACPRTKERHIFNLEKVPGRVIENYKAKSTLETKNIQSGGVVTAILANAFDEDLIDGAIVMMEDKWTMDPKSYLATSKEDVLKTAGSRYNWNVPILEVLKEAVMVKKLNKIAVVGTPCVINAVYQMMATNNDLVEPFKKAIRLKISLFCFETFDYDKMLKKLKEVEVNPWDIKKMEIDKGKLIVSTIHGNVFNFKIDEMDEYVRKGCKVCRDFTGISSDISVGNVGTPEGYSTVLVRNKWGKGFFDRAVINGYVSVEGEASIDPVISLSKKKMERKDIEF
ncbi:coenzyme F420 hydrogenase subunit beta [Methanococcus maripaludis]|uniref:Coenzyme F420 hydrogenase subunit beta n=1 Tax=Methanococcus maripaludis TaxID=39152 RepID=A0A7J9NKD7_METMI|nr:Coenzyme F420 hydrogenase/dehydrogenase, beta subunit C-terminal domain [Methanococcus maripaludis]MBA2845873.1 coenzyme F420 hydrogenase subunit beta [Methanococcus maripaludis]MBB6068305.1 coenzyme F420 hydrogenase subunit beta [Methanococcus maripaludis]